MAEIETMLDEIDALLRVRLRLRAGESSIAALIARWRTRCQRGADLQWIGDDHRLEARVGRDELIIKRREGGGHVLLYRWDRRSWCAGIPRELGRGDADELKRRAAAILDAGGPFGGPDVWDPRSRRLPLLDFDPPDADGVYIAAFGRGYEARVLPVGREAHALVVISPRGSFLFGGFGSPINLGLRAYFHAGDLDVVEEDIPVEIRPFHVVVEGVPYRLTFTPPPGLLGAAVTPVGEVFLLLLGVDDLALVLEEPGGALRLLRRDEPRRLSGLVVREGHAELGPLLAPRTFDREGVAAALMRVTTLPTSVRDGLCRVLDDAQQRVGMEMARRLIWAIVAAHALGQRDRLVLETQDLFQWFLDRGLLADMPCERVRRESLRWLEARTGLVSRSRKGSPIWRVHFDLLEKPDDAFLARIAP